LYACTADFGFVNTQRGVLSIIFFEEEQKGDGGGQVVGFALSLGGVLRRCNDHAAIAEAAPF
jgi:hypothetical protein